MDNDCDRDLLQVATPRSGGHQPTPVGATSRSRFPTPEESHVNRLQCTQSSIHPVGDQRNG